MSSPLIERRRRGGGDEPSSSHRRRDESSHGRDDDLMDRSRHRRSHRSRSWSYDRNRGRHDDDDDDDRHRRHRHKPPASRSDGGSRFLYRDSRSWDQHSSDDNEFNTKGGPPPRIDEMFTLKVDNIPYRITMRELKRTFEEYGKLGDIYIPVDSDRYPRGFAFVRYFRQTDAERAMRKLNGEQLGGRRMMIGIARFTRPSRAWREERKRRLSSSYRRRRTRSRSRSQSRSKRPSSSNSSQSRSHRRRRRRRHERRARASRDRHSSPTSSTHDSSSGDESPETIETNDGKGHNNKQTCDDGGDPLPNSTDE